jgi:subtilisin-like proprotein convertase family protein
LTVQFSSVGTNDPDGLALTFSWNFGDGSSPASGPAPSHTFTAPTGVPTGFTVTLTVTNSGGQSAQQTLRVAVNDTPPQVAITSPLNGFIYPPNQTNTLNLAAAVTDAESPDTQLVYQWQTLLQHNSHNHGGPPDANHATTTVLSPTPYDGTNIYYYRIVLTVSDPQGLSTKVESSVFPDWGPNTPPTISPIGNQSIAQNGQTGAIAFAVADAEIAAANLIARGTSSNPTLLPESNIVFGGSGSNRTVTLAPTTGQSGSALVTVTVSDGPLTASTSFTLTVNPVATPTFSNSDSIAILDNAGASPYPSAINVTGTTGNLSNVTVRLNDFNQTWGNDVDVLLVSPTGQKVLLMSDAGTGTTTNATLTISDAAAASLPANGALASGTYKPTNYDTSTDVFPSPAPAAPYAATLAAFNGQPANGQWLLYVRDDGPGDLGNFAGGWSLTLTTVASGPAAPTLSDIADLATAVSTATAAIPFTVADADTPLNSLMVTAVSGNTTLVPNANLVLGGSGTSRTLTIAPATGVTGTATITVTVSDGTLSVSDSFVLTVNAVNTPPTISDIASQVIDEDTSTGALVFTIGDEQTGAASLVVSASSSNATLVPAGAFTFTGSSANRTLTVTPVANLSGSATITVSVSDGPATTTDTFLLTVNPVNDGPTISNIADQSTLPGTPTAALPFTIGDLETAVTTLTTTASSNNTVLVPNANLVFGGSGANRTLTVTPASGQTGTATITVSVSDGTLTATDTFVLTVSASVPGTQTFANSAAISILDNTTASPYPSAIAVSGTTGNLSNVTVRLNGFNQMRGNDVDVLLVSPTGQKVLLMSDAGSNASTNAILTFSDAATPSLPRGGAIASGTYKPTNYDTNTDVFPSPAPAAPYAATLSAFNGQPANGQWLLYVRDDRQGEIGSFAGGWTLTLTTVGAQAGEATSSTTTIAQADSDVVINSEPSRVALAPAPPVSQAMQGTAPVFHVGRTASPALEPWMTKENLLWFFDLAPSGESFQVEVSADGIHWTVLGPTVELDGAVFFIGVVPDFALFYRLAQQAPP